jgi:hypothetical protein
MSHKWTDLRSKLSPERKEEIRRAVESDPAAVSIRKAQEAHRLTIGSLVDNPEARPEFAATLQAEVDIYVSALRDSLRAMGAELQIKAIFPDGEVVIERLEDLDRGRIDPAA